MGNHQEAIFKEKWRYIFYKCYGSVGGVHLKKASIVVDTFNKPPVITLGDEQISVKEFTINEDSGSYFFEIAAHDPDGNSTLLDWEIDYRLEEINASDINKRKLSLSQILTSVEYLMKSKSSKF